MKRSKLVTLGLVLMLGMLIFGTTQQAAADGQAQFYDIWLGYTEAVRIYPFGNIANMEIQSDELAYVMHAFNKESDFHPPVYQVKLYIDGEDVKLKRYSEPLPSKMNRYFHGPYYPWDEHKGGPPSDHWWVFYKVFEPGYFEPGTYSWRVVWLWKHEVVYDTAWDLPDLELTVL